MEIIALKWGIRFWNHFKVSQKAFFLLDCIGITFLFPMLGFSHGYSFTIEPSLEEILIMFGFQGPSRSPLYEH